jgi:AAA ATPase domain
VVVDLRALHVNLGGVLAPDEVVGREREVGEIVKAIDGPGALLTGDRRMGKTSVIRAVEAEVRAQDYPVVRISAERTSLEEFVDALAESLAHLGTKFRREVERWRVTAHAGPVTAQRVPAPRSLDGLVRRTVDAAAPHPLVLMIDEVPVLAKTLEGQRPGAGGHFLHLMRRLRQDYDGLRMVLSGSIGFHHVTGEAPGTVNDVQRVRIGPLEDADALYLARCLLLGERVPTTDDVAVAQAIASAAENVPYYEHHLVRAASRAAGRASGPVGPEHIPGLVEVALRDPDDPWDLRHYRDRLEDYYGAQTPLVAAILDEFASTQAALTVDDLLRRLAFVAELPAVTRAEVTLLLERLEADHYLVRQGDGDHFPRNLVRRAWLAFRR